MNNFTAEDKAALLATLEAGDLVYEVAYDPTTVIGDPEATALSAGLTEYYREDTAHLVEVIYVGTATSPDPDPTPPPIDPSIFYAPGPGAIEFDDASLDYAASSDWALGTGDFTIEWYQFQTGGSPYPRIFSVNNWPTASIGVSIESGGSIFYLWVNGTAVLSPTVNTIGVWTHFAITRTAGKFTVWQNGQLLGQVSDTGHNISDASDDLYVGNEPLGDAPFSGKLTNFRWVKGTAVYTAPFSNPGTLTAISGTKLLLQASSAGTVTHDSSTNNLTPTISGTITWTTAP
jgi:hypothetical protein